MQVQWTKNMVREAAEEDEDDRDSADEEPSAFRAEIEAHTGPDDVQDLEGGAGEEVDMDSEAAALAALDHDLVQLFAEQPIDRTNCPTAVTIRMLEESHAMMWVAGAV